MSSKPCWSRWRRTAATMSSGRWSGTIRMSSRAWAWAGVTVLGVGSVWPAHRPWRLSVVSKVAASSAATPSRPPRKRSTPHSARMSSSSRRSIRASVARWAAVGGRLPASSPSTAGRPPGSHNVASACTSRWPALGSRTDRLECASWVMVRRWSSSTTIPLPPPTIPGRPAMSRLPPSISAASASRSEGRRSSSASSALLPVSSWPSTRKRTRQGSGPTASRHASTAQTRGSSSPLLSVAPRAHTRPSRTSGS